MTMALPIAFAACTSDEFESFNNQGDALKNRKDLGQVALMFEGDAQTRWTEGLLPEVDDRVGAVLIDDLDLTANGGVYNEEDPISNYETNPNQIFSNYMYENDGTAWRTNANLVEGGYYFYAPYVAHQGRGLLELNTPVVQTVNVDAEGNIEANSAIANLAKEGTTPFYIGYKFLSSTEDNTNITISMKHIFAYPEITLTNETEKDIELSRMLIQSANGFIASGELANEKIGGTKGVMYITGNQDAESIAAAKKESEDYDITKDPTLENYPEFRTWGAWQQVFAYDEGGKTIPTQLPNDLELKKTGLEELATADLLKETETTNLIRVDFSENITVASGESISFRVVLPAAEYKANDLTLWFVVPSGKAYQVGVEGAVDDKVTTMLGDRYAGEDYSEDGELKTGAKQFEVAIDKDNDDLKDAPSVVTTTEALIDLLRYERANTGTLNVTLAGSDIEFNQSVLNAIANIKSQSVAFSGIINIVGSTDEEKPMVIDEEVIFDQAIVKEGYTTFENNGLGFGNVTIEKGATLNVESIKATQKGYTQGVITNKGNLVVGGKTVGNATIDEVLNYGSITFAGKGTITTLNDMSKDEAVLTITVAEGAEYTYRNGDEFNVINSGTLEIEAGAEIAGNITNNGVIELLGAATNKGTLTNAAGAEINGEGTLTNAGKLENSGVVNCDVTNGDPETDGAKEGTTYTITAKSNSQFMGKVSGTVKNAETNSFVVESNAVLVNVDNSKLAVVYNAGELNEKTVLPKLVGENKGIINTLNVTSVSLTDNAASWTAADAYADAVEVINVNGNMNIVTTWTLPTSVTDMNIKTNSQMNGEGTLKFQNATKLAKINIAQSVKLTVVGGKIEGGNAKVEMVSLYDLKKPETIKNRGQFESIKGTLTNVVYDEEDGDWFVNNGGTVTAGTIAADTEINYNGEYKLGNDAKISKFGKDVTYVKLVADGNNKSAVIAKDLVGDKKNVHVLVGAGVTLTLGVDPGDYTGVADIDKAVTGEEGAILIIKRDQDAKRVWKDGKWEVSK